MPLANRIRKSDARYICQSKVEGGYCPKVPGDGYPQKAQAAGRNSEED